jgi:hypothetical protein
MKKNDIFKFAFSWAFDGIPIYSLSAVKNCCLWVYLICRCHSLVYASFCYCEHVTDAGVELLGTLPSLISLDLSGCNIQDQGVAALGNNPQFRDIILSECSSITDLGLQVSRWRLEDQGLISAHLVCVLLIKEHLFGGCYTYTYIHTYIHTWTLFQRRKYLAWGH